MQLDSSFLNSIGLASSFVSTITVIVMIGIIFLYFKTLKIKKIEKQHKLISKMSTLIVLWSITFSAFFFVDYFLGTTPLIKIIFLSVEFLVLLHFILFFKDFWKSFDKFYLTTAGCIAFCVLLLGFVFIVFKITLFYYLASILIPFSPILGILMIVKFFISQSNEK